MNKKLLKLQYNLYEMAVNQVILNLIRFDDEVLTPKVHDWFINDKGCI